MTIASFTVRKTWGVCAGLALLLSGCQIPPLPLINTSNKVFLNGSTGVVVNMPPDADFGPMVEMPVAPYPSNCSGKIALIDVDGVLLNEERTGLFSLGQNPVAVFREKLDYVATHPNFSAVVLRINSPGGGVTATDMMTRELIAFKARTGLPVVACLMDVGAGGGYYLATVCDHIQAHPTTLVGGIGVILNLYNLQDAMAQWNIVAVPVKSGKHTDIGTPIEPATKGQRKLLTNIAEEFHQRFIEIVRQQRPQVDAEDKTTFDGRIFTAAQAMDRRLIDSVGYLDEAFAKAAEMGGAPTFGVVMVHRCNDRVNSAYDITPNTPLQKTLLPINMPGLDRSKLPTYLYIWQPDPSLAVSDKP